VRPVRAGWTNASFLLYAGALIVLLAAFAWLGVISDHHGQGAFAGFAALFWGLDEALALWLLLQGRHLVAGLFAFVGLGLWGLMIGAFFNWWGWLPEDERPFGGFHLGVLGLTLLVLLAALVDLRIWRFPLLVAVAAAAAWWFVTDLLSSGGNWSAWVTLLVGVSFFFVGVVLDAGTSRPYGFWVHVAAGLTVGGALLYFWHSSDAQWALIVLVALLFIAVGTALGRSSYVVLSVGGLALATGHYAVGGFFDFGEDVRPPANWAGPVAFLCLGFFLALIGMLLYRQRSDVE
jgi:hypothetical protein